MQLARFDKLIEQKVKAITLVKVLEPIIANSKRGVALEAKLIDARPSPDTQPVIIIENENCEETFGKAVTTPFPETVAFMPQAPVEAHLSQDGVPPIATDKKEHPVAWHGTVEVFTKRKFPSVAELNLISDFYNEIRTAQNFPKEGLASWI